MLLKQEKISSCPDVTQVEIVDDFIHLVVSSVLCALYSFSVTSRLCLYEIIVTELLLAPP